MPTLLSIPRILFAESTHRDEAVRNCDAIVSDKMKRSFFTGRGAPIDEARILIALIVFPAQARTEPIDPACSTNRSLQVLDKCVPLYCGQWVKVPNTRDNLKFVDETLQTFNRQVAALSDTVAVYQKACQALDRKLCKTCPQRDAVNLAVLNLQMKHWEADETAKLIERQKSFSEFAAVVSRDENNLRCGAQISDATAKAIELQHDMTRRFASTKCGAGK